MFARKNLVQVVLAIVAILAIGASFALAFSSINWTSSTPSMYFLQIVDSVVSPVNFTILGSPFSSGTNGVREKQNLTFDFYFYGVRYTQVGVGYNGNLQWGSIGGTSGLIPAAIPTSAITQPILAWFATDLNCLQNTCGGGVGVIGSAPNRAFIVRARSWTYQSSVSAGTGNVTVDILLYETSNVIEIRYYSVSALPSTSFSATVGVQQTDSNWLAALSASNSAPVNTMFQGRTLKFVPVNNWAVPRFNSTRPVLRATRSANATYSFRVINAVPARPDFTIMGSPFTNGYNGVRENIPITFPFKFFETTYTLLGVGYNGNVQWGNSEVSGIVPVNGIPTASLGFPVLDWFSVDMACQKGACGGGVGVIGTAPSRQFIIRVNNWGYQVSYTIQYGQIDVDIVLSEQSNSIEIRFYTISALPSSAYPLTLGLQNAAGTDYLVFFNASSSVDVTNALMGRTIVLSRSS